MLTIGQVAERSGVPHTALRFYEERGLITSERTSGNQRRYPRHVLRRLAFFTHAVGAATLGVISRFSEAGPVAVVVDDAHLLDRPTLDSLAFAARRLPRPTVSVGNITAGGTGKTTSVDTRTIRQRRRRIGRIMRRRRPCCRE